MDLRGLKRTLRYAVGLLIATLAAACGGGGTQVGGGGSGGTGIGPVTGFGSVTVNGVRYATDNANIVVGGVENRPETELQVGMRVRVDGAFSATGGSGTATRIEAIREVLGPLDDNGADLPGNRLRVAGQTVLVDPATIFDNVSDLEALQAIQAGTLRHPEVEVHGAADDNGSIHATYVRMGADDFPPAEEVTVRGRMRNFSGVTRTFTIGSLPVAYPLTGLERIPPNAVFADGIYVEARGALTAVGGAGTLNARRIEALDNAVGANNDSVRVEGYVVSGTSKNSFTLLGPGGNVSVDGVAATLVPADAAIGAGGKVQVEGTMGGTVLKASVVRVRAPNSVKIEGTVTGTPNAAAGTFTVLSKTIQIDGYTKIKDSDGGIRAFGLPALAGNDNVRVVGVFDNVAGVVRAALVERLSSLDDDHPLLQGPVDPGSIELSQLRFDILGIRVTSVTNFTNTEFRDASGAPVDFPTFFTIVLPALRPDQAVKVRRGEFFDGAPTGSISLIRDDDASRSMEVEIEQVNE